MWTHRCPGCHVDLEVTTENFYSAKPGRCIRCKRELGIARYSPRHCVECGVELPRSPGPKKWCEAHHPRNQPKVPKRKGRPLSPHKKDHCEDCGFRGRGCQLDVRHLDHDQSNHDPSNLRTLCANCHRLYKRGLRLNLDLTEEEQSQLERFHRDVDPEQVEWDGRLTEPGWAR